MGFFQDAIAVFKKRDLAFIESYKESDEVYSFLFETDNDLSWKAGQHGLFTITHQKIKNGTKPFTITSAPSENLVRITTKVGANPSEFKKAMLALKKGDTIRMSGPLGNFHVVENGPTLLIAGGMGITPFRAILKQIEAEGNEIAKQIHLLYLDSNKSYIFKDEIDQIANKSSVKVTYLDSRDDLQKEIDQFVTSNKHNSQYFIAGPKSMVDSVSTHLQSKKISKKKIKKDAFYGY
ncbi:FAD-dependent oxidoreductase [Bacillus nitroreducens]